MDPLPGQVIPPPDPVVIDEEPEYLVERILDVTTDKRYRPPRFTYLVKWVGYDEPSPEPPKHVDHCQDLVEEFHATHPSKPRPPPMTTSTRPRRVRTRQITSEDVTVTSSHV